jgi:hypothetical protein
VLLMDATDEIAIFAAEHPLQRPLLWRNNVDLDFARSQRSRNFKSDEQYRRRVREQRRRTRLRRRRRYSSRLKDLEKHKNDEKGRSWVVGGSLGWVALNLVDGNFDLNLADGALEGELLARNLWVRCWRVSF